jgi:hypothetical protein
MNITILANRYDYKEAIEEERNRWLCDILAYLGIEASILDEDTPDIVDILFANGIDIIDYPSIGAVEVRSGSDLIGEWAGPTFVLKQDNETGGLYYEISVECWSISDEEIDMS